jgi:hypothetical protein
LHLGHHRRHAVEDVGGGEDVAPLLHQPGDGGTVASGLDHPVGEHRNGLG